MLAMANESIPLTAQGYVVLKEELHNLKVIERPKIILEIAEARGHGDLKENAEYHAAREKQGFIEGRIADLDDKLARAKVIDFSGDAGDRVKFGAYVTLSDDESGETKTYRIVGDLEADIRLNKISVSSPIARALLGRRVDDAVEVQAPKGSHGYVITHIQF